MQKQLKFTDLKILSLIEQTHQQSTKVYLAKHSDKIVVCKSILKSSIIDDKRLQHLSGQKEALQYFTNLPSQHINHIVCTFKDSQCLYFLLEPVEGLPLHRLAKMIGKFKPEFVALVIVQLIWILEEFHGEGYIYRDIKASNFIVNRLGKVTMVDLGLAKKIKQERTKTICGTLHAIPPEVLLGGGSYEYSYEFDYYQLGVLLFELLVGRPPFGYENTNANIRQDISKGLTENQLSEIKDPTALDLIKKLLDKPSTRIGSKGKCKEIMSHEYIAKLDLKQLREIFEGRGQKLVKKWGFEAVLQQIQDFGLEESRYEESSEDPFSGF